MENEKCFCENCPQQTNKETFQRDLLRQRLYYLFKIMSFTRIGSEKKSICKQDSIKNKTALFNMIMFGTGPHHNMRSCAGRD